MGYRVFISSVIQGFGSERTAARAAVESLRQQPVMAEDLGAKPYSPQTACLEGVRSSQIYLGILGTRYGFVAKSGVSVTEEEFLEARQRGLRILFFVQDVKRDAQQQQFLDRIKDYEEGYFLDLFTTPGELNKKVVKALYDEIAQPNVLTLDGAGARQQFDRHGWGGRREAGSNTWLGTVFLPSRYGEEYLSVLDLGDQQLRDRLLQQALFGPGAFFRKDVGSAERDGETHFVLEQESAYRQPIASLEVWSDGTLICGASLGAGQQRSGLLASFLIDEAEVEHLLAVFCKYADGFYSQLDRGPTISSLYVGLSLSGLHYKAFGPFPTVEPRGGVTVPTHQLSDPLYVPSTPLKMARPELTDPVRLARKLTETTARVFRAAGAHYGS